ncbi:N-acetylglucosamine kinase [Limoniibacter endophyticus]|uniref:N-acetylglucosamine kinase n=2 Tax=Limoniibacter endophyticus TaxID=1565040 RepID=A0A8J3DRF7_9HYPH|nr:N-acetylglucosamine kinase [Limoniibacter endophyticus]
MIAPRAPLVIGIDGGGTSCRVAIAKTNGVVIAGATGGSANIFSDPDGAIARIRKTIVSAGEDAGLTPDETFRLPAVLGLAGVNIGHDLERVGISLGLERAKIVTDAEIALEGALGSDDGIVAIIGTGSVYLRRLAGRIDSIGGWGFTLGDQSSGARLGRDCLEHTLLAHDGIIAAGNLSRSILEKFDYDPVAIVSFARSAQPGDFARFAGDLFRFAETADPLARLILNEAITYIESAVGALQTGRLPLVLLGGLASSYRPYLPIGLTQEIIEPKGSALDGALAMALKL